MLLGSRSVGRLTAAAALALWLGVGLRALPTLGHCPRHDAGIPVDAGGAPHGGHDHAAGRSDGQDEHPACTCIGACDLGGTSVTALAAAPPPGLASGQHASPLASPTGRAPSAPTRYLLPPSHAPPASR